MAYPVLIRGKFELGYGLFALQLGMEHWIALLGLAARGANEADLDLFCGFMLRGERHADA